MKPDPEAAARIEELTRRFAAVYELRGKPPAPDRLHVTLAFLDEFDRLPPKLVAAGDSMAGKLRARPFEVRFDRVMSFASTRPDAPLVLCRDDRLPQLDALCQQLGVDTRSFKPHVTLLRDPQMVSLQEVVPISWIATEVLLIHSFLKRGRHHEVLGRYPLG